MGSKSEYLEKSLNQAIKSSRGHNLAINPWSFKKMEEQNTIDDLRRDLENYVNSVAEIESENKEFKKRIAHLENERELEAERWLSILNKGKESWREQAIQHGRYQKKQTMVECEKVMQAFQSELRTQYFQYQTKDSSVLLSCLLRANSSAERAEHDRGVFESMALFGAIKPTVTVQDFDIEDNHVSISNRTDMEVSLTGCSLKFKGSNAKYKFPDDLTIHPTSTISVWYGKEANSSIRQAKNRGSLYWHSDSAITTDFSESVGLVCKKGTTFCSVLANKERQSRHAIGHDPTDNSVAHHSHFLRFDHFFSLKNDEFGEPLMGHQEDFADDAKHPRSFNHSIENNFSGEKSSSSSMTSSSSSSRKRRYSVIASPQPITAKKNAIVMPNNSGEKGSIVTSQSSTLSLSSALSSHFTSPSVLNIRPLRLRPYLPLRSQGCLYFKRVLRRQGESSQGAVAITISNSEEGPVALDGWRLIAVGNPSHEFFLPSDAVIPGRSSITLLSSTCDDTLLWAQIKLSANDIDVLPNFDLNKLKSSDVNDGKMPRSNKKKGKGCLGESSSSTHSAPSNVDLGGGGGGVTEGQIAVVAGLSALSKGDILCLHLIDQLGRNICMIQGISTEIENTHMEDTTVFGDRANERDKNLYPTLSTLTNIAKNSSNSCSVQ